MASLATWIETRSGTHVDILNPDPSAIRVEDIAHALACTNRYGGHLYAPYSVAQHAVIMSEICPPDLAFECLHHDDEEAFIGDMPSPFKKVMPEFKKCAARLEAAIRAHLGLPGDKHPATVKHWDNVMLMTEARDFQLGWYGTNKHVDMPAAHPFITITPWPWDMAKRRFLQRHHELTS